MAAVASSPSPAVDGPKPDTGPAPPSVADNSAPSLAAPQNPNPSLAPPPAVAAAPPPPPVVPSFRPLGAPPPGAAMPVPQYSAPPVPGPGAYAMHPGVRPPVMMYPPQSQPGMPMPQQYAPVPNGYMPVPPPQAHGALAPPGVPRFPGPYPGMMRHVFPARPLPAVGVIPQVPRPPILGVRTVGPIVSPPVRPIVPVIPVEKPQTTVYVGKIASTVENDFLLSLLRLCGPVKSWKRAQDPSDGTPKAFGFCEFETAEGVLRAMRLLSKLNVDGQELVLNINVATKEYLEKYVEKRREDEKKKASQVEGADKEGKASGASEENDAAKPPAEQKGEGDDPGDEKTQDETKNFGLVTDEDREVDKEAAEKLSTMIEERLKTRPTPPPPSADGSVKSQTEINHKAKDGDSEIDVVRSDSAQGKNDDDNASENKSAVDNDKSEISSPDRKRRESRDRERPRDRREREKDYEHDKISRERERERARRERDRDSRNRESERQYRERLMDWEAREREKEHLRGYEKEREKERERERRREILRQEMDDDNDSRKRRHRSSFWEERKRRRLREIEEDLADRLKEEEEAAEAKRRAIEEQQRQEELKVSAQVDAESAMQVDVEHNKPTVAPEAHEDKQEIREVISSKNELDEFGGSTITSDGRHNSVPSMKLGFGLIGSGKRANVPSVFGEEDDEDVDEKKMRPLVPIDYSTEELTGHGNAANNVAASDSNKRSAGLREDKSDVSKERSKRSRVDDEAVRLKGDGRERAHERTHDREKDGHEKPKLEEKKILDAKQLIDMIPKTKDELFSYNINWAVYDKHGLHERMRPWISKKITEFLGEEEATLVDYIVSCTKEHVQASRMLELLQSILDDEAEMFVLKMWRMLIYEIKRLETGLGVKPSTRA